MSEPIVEHVGPDGPIRRFVDTNMQSKIDAAVAHLGDKSIAVIGTYNTKNEAVLSAVWKVGKEWSVVGVLDHTPTRGWEGEAAVMWSR